MLIGVNFFKNSKSKKKCLIFNFKSLLLLFLLLLLMAGFFFFFGPRNKLPNTTFEFFW